MDWQTPLALLCVLLAAAMLVRSLWPGAKQKAPGCGSGCGSCPAGQNAASTGPLVMLDAHTEKLPASVSKSQAPNSKSETKPKFQ
ncbi:FeoB-associated Cys-rich membrane protein [Planctomicrobium piriforme]|uniref:FeoB-associated Cys-rich membrane protein n=1 Tax=Planctomicrobium piriforme TaxID=1576369 RepID=UPI0011144E37